MGMKASRDDIWQWILDGGFDGKDKNDVGDVFVQSFGLCMEKDVIFSIKKMNLCDSYAIPDRWSG